MKSKSYWFAAGLAVAILSSALSGCTTGPAPYGPKTERSGSGYSDERLTQNRYRVTYSGTVATPRSVVEDYLLYRAAELTLASGYAAFTFDTRDTKAKTTYLSSFSAFPNPYGYPDPFGWYWHSWPYDEDVQTRPVTRYDAYAEIVMLTADQAKAEPHALDAQDLMTRLAPRVIAPAQPKS